MASICATRSKTAAFRLRASQGRWKTNFTAAFQLDLQSATPAVLSFVGGGGKSSAMFRMAQEIANAGQRAITTTTTRIFAAQIAQSPAHLAIGDGLPDWADLERLLDLHGQCLLITSAQGGKALGMRAEIVDALARRAPKLGVCALLVEADGSRRLPAKAPADHEPMLPETTTHLVPVLGLDAIGALIDDAHIHRSDRVLALLNDVQSSSAIHQAPIPPRLTPARAATLLTHPDGGAKGRQADMQFLPLLNKADTPTRLVTGRLLAALLADQGQPALLGAVGVAKQTPIRERWGPITAVVLAGGAARRFGDVKQIQSVAGRPMVIRAVESALAAPVQRVLVITGAYHEIVQQVVREHFGQALTDHRLELLHNPDWEQGQATTMHTAIRALDPVTQALLFLPADQPWAPPLLLRWLIQGWRDGFVLAAPTVGGQPRGAPALFDRSLFAELLAISGDTGGRSLLTRYRDQLYTVPTPGPWLVDVDRPEDLSGDMGT